MKPKKFCTGLGEHKHLMLSMAKNTFQPKKISYYRLVASICPLQACQHLWKYVPVLVFSTLVFKLAKLSSTLELVQPLRSSTMLPVFNKYLIKWIEINK